MANQEWERNATEGLRTHLAKPDSSADRVALVEQLKASRSQHDLKSAITNAQFAFDLLKREWAGARREEEILRTLSYLEKSLRKIRRQVLGPTECECREKD